MELKEFVSETLKQIVEGVVLAQQDAKQHGAIVNPAGVMSKQGGVYLSNGSAKNVQLIDFDISLTETEASKAGARIGVLFGSLGAGAHGTAESGSNAINRIKFTVPIVLPTYVCPP